MSQDDFNIHDIIESLIDSYGISPYKINCGLCEEFANDLADILPEAVVGWVIIFVIQLIEKNMHITVL